MDDTAFDAFDVLRNRYRERKDLEDAVAIQDRLRKKSGDWSGEDEVKQWRKER